MHSSGENTPVLSVGQWHCSQMWRRRGVVGGVRRIVRVIAVLVLVLCSATNFAIATGLAPDEPGSHLQVVNQTRWGDGAWRRDLQALSDRLISEAPNVWQGVGIVAQNVSRQIASFREKLKPMVKSIPFMRRPFIRAENTTRRVFPQEDVKMIVALAKFRYNCTVRKWRPVVQKAAAALEHHIHAIKQQALVTWKNSRQFVEQCSNRTAVEEAFVPVSKWVQDSSSKVQQTLRQTWSKTLAAAPERVAHWATEAAPKLQQLLQGLWERAAALLRSAWAQHRKAWAFQTRMGRALWREAQAAAAGLPETSAAKFRSASARVVAWWDPDSRPEGGGAAGQQGTTSRVEQEKNFARWRAGADSDEIGEDDDEI